MELVSNPHRKIKTELVMFDLSFINIWQYSKETITTSFNKAWTQVLHRFESC